MCEVRRRLMLKVGRRVPKGWRKRGTKEKQNKQRGRDREKRERRLKKTKSR